MDLAVAALGGGEKLVAWRGQDARTKAAGVMPVILRKARVKWLWSAKPVPKLSSESETRGSSKRSQAVRMRRRWTCSPMPSPTQRRNTREMDRMDASIASKFVKRKAAAVLGLQLVEDAREPARSVSAVALG